MDASQTYEFTIANGVRLHYVAEGSGPLMLMLHGFPEFWYSWRYQIPEFAKDYRVVALDLRGYNESGKPKNPSAYQMSVLVDDIRAVIESLGYDRAILVGHDWGGAIAWNVAYAYPSLIEKLIVLNIPHPAKFSEGMQSIDQLQKSWYVLAFQIPGLPELLLQWDDYRAIESIFVETAANPNVFSAADIEAYKNAAAKRGAIAAMLSYYRQIFPNLFEEREWGILQVPTLMVWGEKDTALGKELTFGTDVYVRDFQVRYIPDVGHWVQQEAPELVNEYMREFVTIQVA